jgi:hypothetical protein
MNIIPLEAYESCASQFPTVSIRNIVGARTFEVGATLATFNIWS